MKGASRIFASSIAGKDVMDINGGVIGEVENLIFDIKTGQIIDFVIKPDSNLPRGKYKEENKFILIPFGSVSAVKDVIVVDNSSIDRK